MLLLLHIKPICMWQTQECIFICITLYNFMSFREERRASRYWSGLPCPPPGDLPNPGIEARSPTLQVDSLPSTFWLPFILMRSQLKILLVFPFMWWLFFPLLFFTISFLYLFFNIFTITYLHFTSSLHLYHLTFSEILRHVD